MMIRNPLIVVTSQASSSLLALPTDVLHIVVLYLLQFENSIFRENSPQENRFAQWLETLWSIQDTPVDNPLLETPAHFPKDLRALMATSSDVFWRVMTLNPSHHYEKLPNILKNCLPLWGIKQSRDRFFFDRFDVQAIASTPLVNWFFVESTWTRVPEPPISALVRALQVEITNIDPAPAPRKHYDLPALIKIYASDLTMYFFRLLALLSLGVTFGLIVFALVEPNALSNSDFVPVKIVNATTNNTNTSFLGLDTQQLSTIMIFAIPIFFSFATGMIALCVQDNKKEVQGRLVHASTLFQKAENRLRDNTVGAIDNMMQDLH